MKPAVTYFWLPFLVGMIKPYIYVTLLFELDLSKAALAYTLYGHIAVWFRLVGKEKIMQQWNLKTDTILRINIVYIHTGARAYYRAYFGQGTGTIHMTYVGCTGTESRLLSCVHSSPYRYYIYPYRSSCAHYEDAGVKCQGT